MTHPLGPFPRRRPSIRTWSFLFLAGSLAQAHPPKADPARIVAAADRSCHAIDQAVRNGSVTAGFVAEVPSEGASRWVTYGSEADLEKSAPKECWRRGSFYRDGSGLRMAELETKTPTKEWVQRIRYYFRPDGSLQRAHSEFRSFGAYERSQGPDHQFLVKVIRDRYYDDKGHCVKKAPPRVVNRGTHREPKGVVFTDGPWPLYPTVTKLPFYGSVQAQPTPVKK